ncbi:MAG: hypothetical protein ACK5L3_05135 [Oscillospiraceae bacterium]
MDDQQNNLQNQQPAQPQQAWAPAPQPEAPAQPQQAWAPAPQPEAPAQPQQAWQPQPQQPWPQQQQPYPPAYPYQGQYGGGVPEEIKKWNWGAFMFNVYWGIGNRAYMALLCFVPLLNIVWPFICGIKGNEWAWEAGNYTDVATFRAVQDTWNRAGKIGFFIALGLTVFIVVMYAALFAALFSSLRYMY